MASKITRPAQSWTYILDDDRDLPDAEQSRFTLRPLTQQERAVIRDEIGRIETGKDGTKSVISRSYRQGIEIVLDAIVSIENFPAGAPQPWPDDRQQRRQYIDMLSDHYVQELANEAWFKSVAGDDVKNS
jgi:hypothetical protein